MKIDQIIKDRKTEKVLAEKPWSVTKSRADLEKTINALLSLAASAPYHKKCHESYTDTAGALNSCLPWRFYVLDTTACRRLYDHIAKEEIKAGKVSNMLAAADALLMVNWLPEPLETEESEVNESTSPEEPFPFTGNMKNMEHIAAASAAIQNVLIGATARNIPNYWSSGGHLRKAPLRNYLNIPLQEILLGALFLFPEDLENKEVTIKPGALRDQGKKTDSWSRWVNL